MELKEYFYPMSESLQRKFLMKVAKINKCVHVAFLLYIFPNRSLPVRGHPGLQEPAGDHRQQLDRLDRAFQRAAECRRGAERSACDASEHRGSAQRARDRQAVRPQALRPQHHR